MEQDKNKIREPYSPEGTPNPPQTIDPSIRKERNEKEAPVTANKEQSADQKKRETPGEPAAGEEKEKKKLLGESEIEIDDETTI